MGQHLRSSTLMQAVETFGSPELVSGDIDLKFAEMVNFIFDNGLSEEDYKDICEDAGAKWPAKCHALTLVDCNLQVLEVFHMDAKKADLLKNANKDIQKTVTTFVSVGAG